MYVVHTMYVQQFTIVHSYNCGMHIFLLIFIFIHDEGIRVDAYIVNVPIFVYCVYIKRMRLYQSTGRPDFQWHFDVYGNVGRCCLVVCVLSFCTHTVLHFSLRERKMGYYFAKICIFFNDIKYMGMAFSD